LSGFPAIFHVFLAAFTSFPQSGHLAIIFPPVHRYVRYLHKKFSIESPKVVNEVRDAPWHLIANVKSCAMRGMAAGSISYAVIELATVCLISSASRIEAMGTLIRLNVSKTLSRLSPSTMKTTFP
jgi:hypothetical protein